MIIFHRLLYFFIILTLFHSCTGCPPRPAPDPNCLPESRKATYIESPSSTEIIFRATGIGRDFGKAFNDSKKAALWFAIHYIVKSPDGRNKLNLGKYLCDSSPEKYIRWQSDCLKKVTIAGNIYLDYQYKIDIEMLRSHLFPNCGIPLPSIAVLSSDPSNKLNPVAVSVIKEYLIDRGYEVFIQNDMSKTGKITELTRKIIGQEVDPIYQMAIKLGADIYIKITNIACRRLIVSGVTTLQSSVTMEALDTATDQQVGATSGQSKQRYSPACEALVQEASQMAANKVINQISRQLKRQTVNGKAYKIVLFASSRSAQTVNKNLYESLKSISNRRIRILGSGRKQFSYIVYLKGINNVYELYEKISNNYSGPGTLKKEFGKGAFLILTNKSGDEFL